MPPLLWSSVPYGNRTAFADLIGSVELWFAGLAQEIHALTGTSIQRPPIGIGGGKAWLLAVQQAYTEACSALQISPPGDLSSYDLSSRNDFNGWCFTLAQESERLRIAAGLP